MMVDGWQTAPLGEFLAQRKEFFTINDFTRYKRARVQLHGRGIVLRDDVDGVEVKTKEQQAARTGEFLVAEIDAKVGGFGIMPYELDGAIVSSHYFLFEINEQKCLREWLDWFIRSGMLEDQVTAHGSTNYSAIRPSHVLKYQIPLPPLTEQRRIVARIEALARRVAEAQSLRREVSEEAGILINCALSIIYDDLIARFGTQKIGTVANVKGGKRLPAGERLSDTKTPFVYIRVSDMKNHSVDMSDLKYVPEHIQSGIARYTISSKDVYVTIAGTIGYPGTIPAKLDGANLTENAAKLVFHEPEKISQAFVVYSLRSPQVQEQFRVKKTEAAQPKLALHRIESTLIPLPPLEEQRRLVAYLDGLQAQVSALRVAQSETEEWLSALMPSILYKAFKGEL